MYMAKSDKELTSEVVCAYLNAWGTQQNGTPPKQYELSSLINEVYNAIHTLGYAPENSEN